MAVFIYLYITSVFQLEIVDQEISGYSSIRKLLKAALLLLQATTATQDTQKRWRVSGYVPLLIAYV